MLRQVCGVNQALLCERAGVSRQSMNEYENGRAFPSRELCQRIDEAFVSILDERVLFIAAQDPKVRALLDQLREGTAPTSTEVR